MGTPRRVRSRTLPSMPSPSAVLNPSRLRIVSLLPSATEIVWALGAGDALVGISHECDFPPETRDRRVLTRARLSGHGSSREIDAAVRAVLHDALSLYAVDDAGLAALNPDVIITQDLCHVCAVSLDDVHAAVARLAGREQVTVISLQPTRLQHVLDDIERVAAGIGRAAIGAQVRAALQARIDAIAERAQRLPVRPRVVSIEWLDPPMLGGTWMPELITKAGGIAVGVQAGAAAPTVTPQDLAALAPDVVLVKPCGFSCERTLAERAILDQTILPVLPSSTRVYVSDGNAFFNRPGPRLVESLEITAACVAPQIFSDFSAKHAAVITRLQ